ncbi:MAG: hypothetical protein A2163_00860 [Actinobacteria bacterium RBG_13_35_12]|nr:MAG: hypothetical protein A2163_00860 [Actinobacteria bacterium RBG_13_35_12]
MARTSFESSDSYDKESRFLLIIIIITGLVFIAYFPIRRYLLSKDLPQNCKNETILQKYKDDSKYKTIVEPEVFTENIEDDWARPGLTFVELLYLPLSKHSGQTHPKVVND